MNRTSVRDPEAVLSKGDVIIVLSPETGKRLGFLQVREHDGTFARLKRLRGA
ncbi:hypothetical protein [Arenibaculum pallidiluteum]|uniref:hypothetical protein n=1 Tax=Arenibaculum pallidiluteum TaxID=2812559 RepID=UPI001A95A151|nr:hypothetical protein [Arenibaculum pallidiluteum]